MLSNNDTSDARSTSLDYLLSDSTVEDEEEEFHDIDRPWDPESIRVTTKNFSLRNMLDAIEEGGLDLAPDFQRLRVWKSVQKAQLIESVLLQIPLPAFYFAEDLQGRLQVVDGVQRLSTINDFVRGGDDGQGAFRLEGLEYIGDVKGKRFIDLPPVWQRRIYNTQIVAHVISPSTPPEVMYDIFRRINTLGTPLTGQEIRHCISKKRSRDFLKELVQLPSFDIATGGALRDHKRMVDREVALRFVAFWHLGHESYQKEETLDGFLLRAVRALDDSRLVPDEDLTEIRQGFARGLSLAHAVFADHAFRKWPTNEPGRKPLNRALFEAWTVELARADVDAVLAHAESIKNAARTAMTRDWDYLGAISSATGDIRSVQHRFVRTRDIIQTAITE